MREGGSPEGQLGMRQPLRTLITDLDNTLYDWVTFFASSISEMVAVASLEFKLPQETILDELQAVHRRYRNSEQPFALLEIPSLTSRFPGESRNQLADRCMVAFNAFNSERDRTLHLYPGVIESLAKLQDSGISVVGHTEANSVNAIHRLEKLGVIKYFTQIFALPDLGLGHPRIERQREFDKYESIISLLGDNRRKPDAQVVLDICREQDVDVTNVLYVGDSLTRDIGMAKRAGVVAAWAKYGTVYDESLWKKVVRITHWTEDDVARARRNEETLGELKPDVTLDRFDEILPLFVRHRE